MKVAKLMELLSHAPPDCEVFIEDDGGVARVFAVRMYPSIFSCPSLERYVVIERED